MVSHLCAKSAQRWGTQAVTAATAEGYEVGLPGSLEAPETARHTTNLRLGNCEVKLSQVSAQKPARTWGTEVFILKRQLQIPPLPVGMTRGTVRWYPTFAKRARKDGAPGENSDMFLTFRLKIQSLRQRFGVGMTRGTEQWNPTFAQRTRKDGAPGDS